jgi:nucleoside-diphosphate-sugar epimerase
MAAQVHVHPRNENENRNIYLSNVEMTKNLLKAADNLSILPKQLIFISSVAVYGCDEGIMIAENFPTNPVSSYGQSKLESERLLTQWCTERNIRLLIFRLPLIAGLNAPGNLGYMERAIQKGTYIKITNNLARKSVVLAANVGELIARTDITASGIYHLTDRRNPSISEIEKAFEKHFHKKILMRVAYSAVKMAAGLFDIFEKIFFTRMPLNSNKFRKLTSELTFNDDTAFKELGWNPESVIDFLSQ